MIKNTELRLHLKSQKNLNTIFTQWYSNFKVNAMATCKLIVKTVVFVFALTGTVNPSDICPLCTPWILIYINVTTYLSVLDNAAT